jgi:hypothetical protein
MSHPFLLELRGGRKRWLKVEEAPFSRTVTYELLEAGLITRVVIKSPGRTQGRRLIDGDSIDRYLESLAAAQPKFSQTKLRAVNRAGSGEVAQ